MRAIAFFLLILFLPAAAHAQRGAKPDLSMTVTGDIEIGPDGNLHAYRLDEGITPAVEQAVAQNLRAWSFEPITVDGRPVIAKTRVRLNLSAEKIAQGYQLRVENVWFGEPNRTSKMTPPSYPVAAARANLGARVLLILKLDASGKVTDVHVEQTSLSAKAEDERSAEKWRAIFEKPSIAAARNWTFNVTEIIGDAPVDISTVRVPVEFAMANWSDNRWYGFIPGPRRPAPWVAEQASAQIIDNLSGNDTQPLDSRFKLKTPIVGALL